MSNAEKLLVALLELLDEGKPITKNSLSVRSGLHRFQIYRMIKKNKEFIDVEVLQ